MPALLVWGQFGETEYLLQLSTYLHYRNVNTNLCWVNFCTYRNVSSLLECSLIDLFQNNSHLKTIHLSDEFHRDIKWFLTFLPTYNGISYICKHRLDNGQSLYLDASLTGMGAVWRNRVYATPIHNCGDLDLKIVHLEILNIIIALKTWGVKWRHSAIVISCDSLGGGSGG